MSEENNLALVRRAFEQMGASDYEGTAWDPGDAPRSSSGTPEAGRSRARRQDARCEVHRISSPIGGSATGHHRITVRARTTGRRWSRPAVRVVDLG
jgi:hypothetical protein